MRLSWPTLIATAAIVAGLNASCASTMTPALPQLTAAGVRFVFASAEAQSVALAGTFNEWSPASHPFARTQSSGIWTVVVALPPGEHHFMYVVDGMNWVSPPAAEDYVDDGFGARNGVVVVRPNGR